MPLIPHKFTGFAVTRFVLEKDGTTRDQKINYGPQVYHPFFRQAIFKTYGWNEPLGRTSRLTPEVFRDEEVKLLADSLNRLYPDASKVPEGVVEIHGLRLSTNRYQSSTGAAYNERIGTIDTEQMVAKKIGTEPFAALISRIEKQTFGCSKEYPEERMHLFNSF